MHPIAGAVVAGGVLLVSMGDSHSCDLIKDPRPTWEEMIGQADVVFVGKVVAIEPKSLPGDADRAVFAVERPVRGELGPTFDVAQGTNSCTEEFAVGDWVLFAGTSQALEGESVTYAESTGWDPTVLLSDPPTPEQVAQLDYLKQITESRYEASQ